LMSQAPAASNSQQAEDRCIQLQAKQRVSLGTSSKTT
jgi:hypothetical protein